MFCKNCGNEIADDALFCPKCGTKLIDSTLSNNDNGHENEAIIGFVLGLISLLFGVTIIIPILGIYFSNKGKNSSKATFAKAGKILSILSLLPAILLLAFIIIPDIGVTATKIVGNNNVGTSSTIPMANEYKTESKEILDWYTSLGLIKTKTMENNPSNIQVDVVLGYNINDKTASNEIEQKSDKIKKFLTQYFTQKTSEDLRPQNEENLKIEILNGINDSILSSSKIKDVRFMQFDVIKQ